MRPKMGLQMRRLDTFLLIKAAGSRAKFEMNVIQANLEFENIEFV